MRSTRSYRQRSSHGRQCILLNCAQFFRLILNDFGEYYKAGVCTCVLLIVFCNLVLPSPAQGGWQFLDNWLNCVWEVEAPQPRQVGYLTLDIGAEVSELLQLDVFVITECRPFCACTPVGHLLSWPGSRSTSPAPPNGSLTTC